MTPPESAFGAPPQWGAPSGPAKPDPRRQLDESNKLDERSLSKLKWRCRRGLLENDLFVARFFQRHEATLSLRHATGLQILMDLADSDLLDLLLARCEPAGELATAEVHDLLDQMRISA